MAIKARNVTLNAATATLLESPEREMTVIMRTDGDVVIGGADLDYPDNVWALTFFTAAGSPMSVVLGRGDDLYAQAAQGTAVISYLVIGD